QFVAGTHPLTGRPGWWDRLVGPGRILDTDRYFIVCANVPGGCMGSIGPASIDPATGRPYGPDFPGLTVADMVRAEALLLDHLGIGDLFLVIGGSMGGMQALEWLRLYPERVFAAAAFAVGARHSAQQIALHAIGRQAILNDPDYQDGRYHGSGRAPVGGLAVARMLAHLSYRSPEELAARFGRRLQDRDTPSYGFGIDYQVESYLAHHGHRFVERFDPLSYLVITKAMDHFDLAPDGDLAAAFRGCRATVFLAAYATDWLYPPDETAALAEGLAAAGLEVDFAVHEVLTGHDSFLLEVPSADRALARFLDRMAARRGL
ncbi:MAG: homoserine O-acetyltransferase, partial [Alphaproteobacteria bacterium]